MFRYEPIKGKLGLVVDEILSGGHKKAAGDIQNVMEESEVQNYDIGTRLVMDDRVFRYCKATEALRSCIGGLCAMSQIEEYTHATASAAGTYEVTVLDVVARVANWYAGGYIWIMDYAPATTGIGELYRIKSSGIGDETSVTLTLEEPLKTRVPASTWVTIWASIYGQIQVTALPKASCVCYPLIEVANGSYFWGQTWGPCFVQCGYSPGQYNNDREMYFKPDHYGCLPGSSIDFSSLGNVIPQRIGFLLPNTAIVGTDNLIMLQISP